MLGKIVKVRVTSPYGYVNKRYGFKYDLNFGVIESSNREKNNPQFAYVMGINHPVKNFDGRVIAEIRRPAGKGVTYVVAPKSTRFINHDIVKAISFAESRRTFTLECFYESSCGAVIFRHFEDGLKFLLIRNKRSANWGFSKGHIEEGETKLETALREIKEETGLEVDVIDGFEEESNYIVAGRFEKTVTLFLAESESETYCMQEEEIAKIGWFSFEQGLKILNFENDKRILTKAKEFIGEKKL